MRAQQEDTASSSDSLATKGAGDFAAGACIGCHTVAGLTTETGGPVAGIGGPDLTHFASRACFAGCTIPMHNEDGSFNEEGLRAWLDNPQSIKPGAKMPDYDLSDDQIDALIAYLMTLE